MGVAAEGNFPQLHHESFVEVNDLELGNNQRRQTDRQRKKGKETQSEEGISNGRALDTDMYKKSVNRINGLS